MQGKADFDTIANFVLMPHLTEPVPYGAGYGTYAWLEKPGGGDRERPSPPGPFIPFPGWDPGEPYIKCKWSLFTSLGLFSAIAIVV